MFFILRYVTLAFVCLVAAVVLWRTLATPHMQVAAVRVTDVVREHADRQGRLTMSKTERLGAAEQFALAFEAAVQEVTDSEGIVLLTSKAVISNIPDMTDRLREEIERTLRQRQ